MQYALHKPRHTAPLLCKGMRHGSGSYLMKYRLERAKELLKRGFSVKSTALSCGFSDSLYFSKLFKAAVGEPPAGTEKRSSHAADMP